MPSRSLFTSTLFAVPTLLALATPAIAQETPLDPVDPLRWSKSVNLFQKKAPFRAEQLPWQKLETEAYRGKQDDIYFINPRIGWYVNGAGRIFRTRDGGKTWEKIFENPGTYFRCVGFVDENHGFAGNIGTDYFPGVSDTTPLYETTDGGVSWKPVALPGAPIKGLCAIDIVRKPFINAGKLDYKVSIFAAGRVGGPTAFIKSVDGGKTWESIDISAQCGMVLDVKFFDDKTGILCAASNPDIQASNALILTTDDGGKTWTKRYQSTRPFEATWKASFPTRNVGYVSVQNYNPAEPTIQRYVAKTIDGGKTWQEIPLTNAAGAQQFGIAFVDDKTGWVGTTRTGYFTGDGGKTWSESEIGRAVNKIRILPTDDGFVGYAIGVDLFKMEFRAPLKP